MDKKIGVGLAGFGTVGAGVYRHLLSARDVLRRRIGVEFEVRRVAVRDVSKPREVSGDLLTGRASDLIEDPEIGVVVELIGGMTTARELIEGALRAGKIVVTGNKALLAEHGEALFGLAEECGVPIFYEAAVAGGIPIIKSVREAFVANRFESMHGILNGTSNYILSRMAEAGIGYQEALDEASALGYAEADPTLDVNGWDAAHKAIILAALAYGFWIPPSDVLVRGIDTVTREDVCFAAELGYCIKLLATIKAGADGIEVRVCPTLIPSRHVLASVGGVFNAIAVHGDIVGETLFYGRGAGQDPTSSSVLGDLAEAAAALQGAPRNCGFIRHELYGKALPVGAAISKFYLRLAVEDRPGVLAQVAGIFGEAGIGISSVIQPETTAEGPVPLILMIHDAVTHVFEAACGRVAALEAVKDAPVALHVEAFAP
jgi:homoserine dehydrogenase